MSTDVRRVMLSLNIDANVAKAKAGMGEVADSAQRVAAEADTAGVSLLGIADKADSAATNFATLAGAAGDIAGGLDSVGLGQFSDELESVAPPLMLIAGLADVTAVATNALSVANIRARATTIAKTVSEKASAAATKAMAAAQWAMNAAMSANPIGLIVLAVVALVAGLVLAYKKSETFRNIVQAVGRIGAQAIGWVVDKVGELVDWVQAKVPPAFDKAKSVAVAAFLLITTPQRAVIRLVTALIGWVRDKLPAAFSKAKGLAVRYLLLITTPQRKVIQLVTQLIGWVRDKLPAAFSKAKDLGVRAFLLITTPQRKVIQLVTQLIGWVRDKLPAGFQRAKELASNALNAILAPMRKIMEVAQNVATAVREKIADGFSRAKTVAVEAMNKVLAPIRDAIDLIQDLIGFIDNIDWPDAPDWLDKVTRSAHTAGIATTPAVVVAMAPSGTTAGGSSYTSYRSSEAPVVIHVHGAVDPERTARQINSLLAGRARLIGQRA